MPHTIVTPDSGSVIARRCITGIDLEVKNEDGETIATVIVSLGEAYSLFRMLGMELSA